MSHTFDTLNFDKPVELFVSNNVDESGCIDSEAQLLGFYMECPDSIIMFFREIYYSGIEPKLIKNTNTGRLIAQFDFELCLERAMDDYLTNDDGELDAFCQSVLEIALLKRSKPYLVMVV